MALRVCIVLTFWLATAAASAAPLTPDYSHVPAMRHLLHWNHLPVRVVFLPGALATDARRKAVLSGFDRWTLATLGRVTYRLVESVKDADITVDFDPHESLPGTKNVAGHTLMVYAGDVLQTAQMTLAIGVTGDDDLSSSDLSNTAAHEFGHALGMDGHSDNSGDLMYPELTRIIYVGLLPLPTLPRLPTARDVNTLKLCYPALWADKAH